MPDKGEIPLPSCKAILLCERAVVEAQTGQISLVGLISELQVASIPCRIPAMKLFLHTVDGIGGYEIKVEIHDLGEDRVVAKGKGARLLFPERLRSIMRTYSLPSLPIHHPGRYDVIVFANEQELGRQQFVVKMSKEDDES